MHRLLAIAATCLAGLVLSGSAMAWSWPADGDVLRPFALGGDAYAAGQHRGIDVAGQEGSPVRAPAAGTVTFVGSLPTYGRGVTIATADGYAVTLVHLGSTDVSKGDAVTERASIGTMGWSGDAEHAVASVHLGVRVAAQAEGYVDPLGLLPPRSVPAPAPPPVQAPAPVAAPAAAASPVPPGPPAVPPTSAAPSPQPIAPAATAPPAAEPPGSPSVTAGQASAAAPTASGSEPAVAADTTTPGGAASPGLDVVSGRANAASDTSFRGDPGRGVDRVPTRTTDPRTNGRPAAAASTPTRPTTQPAEPVVRTASTQATTVPRGPAERVRPPSPGPSAAASDHGRPGVPAVATPPAQPVEARAVPAADLQDTAAPQPSVPSPPAGVSRPSVPSVDGGARPGVLVAAALLGLLAAAAAARATRRIGRNGAVLRHHADLLRQLHPAHRARLHNGGGGRVRTPSTAARS